MTFRILRSFKVLALTVTVTVIGGACSSGIEDGSEGGACYPNQTCNGKLLCLSSLCVHGETDGYLDSSGGRKQSDGGELGQGGEKTDDNEDGSGGSIRSTGGRDGETASGGKSSASGGHSSSGGSTGDGDSGGSDTGGSSSTGGSEGNEVGDEGCAVLDCADCCASAQARVLVSNLDDAPERVLSQGMVGDAFVARYDISYSEQRPMVEWVFTSPQEVGEILFDAELGGDFDGFWYVVPKSCQSSTSLS